MENHRSTECGSAVSEWLPYRGVSFLDFSLLKKITINVKSYSIKNDLPQLIRSSLHQFTILMVPAAAPQLNIFIRIQIYVKKWLKKKPSLLYSKHFAGQQCPGVTLGIDIPVKLSESHEFTHTYAGAACHPSEKCRDLGGVQHRALQDGLWALRAGSATFKVTVSQRWMLDARPVNHYCCEQGWGERHESTDCEGENQRGFRRRSLAQRFVSKAAGKQPQRQSERNHLCITSRTPRNMKGSEDGDLHNVCCKNRDLMKNITA